MVLLAGNILIVLFNFVMFFLFLLTLRKLILYSVKIRFAPFRERVANHACNLFILRLLYCICLSFTLVLGLDVDLIVSVPQFCFLLYHPEVMTDAVCLIQIILQKASADSIGYHKH